MKIVSKSLWVLCGSTAVIQSNAHKLRPNTDSTIIHSADEISFSRNLSGKIGDSNTFYETNSSSQPNSWNSDGVTHSWCNWQGSGRHITDRSMCVEAAAAGKYTMLADTNLADIPEGCYVNSNDKTIYWNNSNVDWNGGTLNSSQKPACVRYGCHDKLCTSPSNSHCEVNDIAGTAEIESECVCDTGYHMENSLCVPDCDSNASCGVGGHKCENDNTCTCAAGYYLQGGVCHTPEPSPAPSVAASSSPTVTASASPTVTASNSPSAKSFASPTVTASNSPSAKASASPTVTASSSPTVTASNSPSAKASASPTQATLAPVPATLAPVPATLAPVPATLAPVPATLAPVPATLAPVPATLAPVQSTLAPVPATLAPVPATFAPVPATFAPVPATLAPVQSTLAPVQAILAPVPAPVPAPVGVCDGVVCKYNGVCIVNSNSQAECKCEASFLNEEDGIKQCYCPAGKSVNWANRCVGPPTASPTKSPIVAPTPSPSTVQIAAIPIPLCEEDDSTFRFTLVKQSGESRSCSWISANSANRDYRRRTYCYKDQVCGEVSEIGNVCKQACGFCEGTDPDPCGEKCDSSRDATFQLHNGNSMSCGWISQNHVKRDHRRQTYCFNSDCTPTAVGDTCFEACGFCDDSWKKSCLATSSPTASPILPPVAAIPLPIPANSCEDLQGFTFPLLSAYDPLDNTQRKTCAWLTAKPDKTSTHKNNYCGLTHVKTACRNTCDSCDVSDAEGDDVFDRKFPDDNGNTVQLSCSWLTKNKNTKHLRIKNYCFADDVCEAASAVGDSCPVACGFADGSNEYRGCPEEVEVEALPEPVLPPVAAFPAPSPSSKGMSKGMSKGSSGSVPSAPSKGYPTDTQNASSPTVGSGKGTSKGSTYAPGSSSTTSSKGMSKGSTYAPGSSGKGMSKGTSKGSTYAPGSSSTTSSKGMSKGTSKGITYAPGSSSTTSSSKGMSKGSTYAPGSSSTTSGKGMSKGTSKGSTYAPGSSSTTTSKGLSKGSTYSPASKGNSKGYTRGLRKMLQKS